jgi:glycosyltransferase involved in cell wall biosynthesis
VTTICLALCARNEEQSLPGCLRSVIRSVENAEARLSLRFDVVVVADDCTDRTVAIAESFHRVRVLTSSGGKVEAQRRVANSTPFVLFCDADILLTDETVAAVCEAMLADSRLQIAYPVKLPLAPKRGTLLAAALHCYNRVNGFQERRRYFNGKFFAIRDWRVPTLAELRPGLAALPMDRFYDFHAGVNIDDIWLSRDILRRHGADAIHEMARGPIWYRPPETFAGMYRTYHRMRREIERLNTMFPETVGVHQKRGYDWDAVRRASPKDRWLWRVFRAALGACQLRYQSEKIYYQRFSLTPCPSWKPINETKRSLDIGHLA